jgi:hypothetical protein
MAQMVRPDQESATWEQLEISVALIGGLLLLAGLLWTLQGVGVVGRGNRTGRRDRLVGGLVMMLFGAAMLATFWIDR